MLGVLGVRGRHVKATLLAIVQGTRWRLRAESLSGQARCRPMYKSAKGASAPGIVMRAPRISSE